MLTLICNHSLALFSFALLIIHSRSSDKFFPNENVQNLNIIWYSVMEKILLIYLAIHIYISFYLKILIYL